MDKSCLGTQFNFEKFVTVMHNFSVDVEAKNWILVSRLLLKKAFTQELLACDTTLLEI